MTESRFVHLHVHSEYSLLDGVCRLNHLVDRAKEYGMTHLGLTDHGVMHGSLEFYKAATAAGVSPIIGVEAYVAPNGIRDQSGDKNAGIDDRNDKSSAHMVLLAKNATGYQNLMRLVSRAQLEGFYYKPRIDHEFLKENSEGIIGTSSCLKGEIPMLVMEGRYEEARALAQKMESILGEGNFFLEVQSNMLEEQHKVNEAMRVLSGELSIPLIATTDVHYIDQADATTQDCLICIGTKKIMSDPNRLKMATQELYFKTEEKMKEQLPDYLDAVDNTRLVADQCHIEICTDGKLLMPSFEIPAEEPSHADYLRKLVYLGAEDRYGEVTDEIRERIERELDVIIGQDFTGYFLIVWDYTNFARKEGISVGPGRGSAAGSVVAYCLRITDIDPLEYGLLFERFLNPERISPPDIDTDFSDKRRDELIRYCQDKYGHDRVAQIATFGTIGAKNAIRDVARVMGLPAVEGDKIAKLIPDGLGVSLSDALRDVPELRRIRESDAIHQELFEQALAVEGMVRQTSTHAAGIIIADDSLWKYTPLMRGANKEKDVATQYEMKSLESIGLLKMDFLGLKNLSVIDGAVESIRARYDADFDINTIPRDDKKTFDLLARAKTNGVFQLESTGMKEVLRKMKPDAFTDVISLIALYRPGPLGSGMVDDFINRKHGEVEFTYDHPTLEPILKETYGVILYQEQVMQIANVIAGFSLGQADQMRRAMGKKKVEILQKMENDFYEGAKKKDVSIDIAKKLWNLIYQFAGYGFNKSHSAAYAVITYQTAYLKAHYPDAFLASLLTTDMHDTNKVVKYLNDCKDFDISVLPPDINGSNEDFTPTDEGIRFGLAAIKSIGVGPIRLIIQERNRNGVFESLEDFCYRMRNSALNKSLVESLIRAGTFDSLEYTRASLLSAYPGIVERIQGEMRDEAVGQDSLFGDFDKAETEAVTEIPRLDELPLDEIRKDEKRLLGFYLTSHPLDDYASESRMFASHAIADLVEADELGKVRLFGIATEIRKKKTRTDKRMAIFQLEDLSGSVEVAVMPDTLEQMEEYLNEEEILVVDGVASQRGDQVSVRADQIILLDTCWQQYVHEMHVHLDTRKLSDDLILQLKGTLLGSTGKIPVVLHVAVENVGTVDYSLESSYTVQPNRDLKTSLENLFGENSVRFTGSNRPTKGHSHGRNGNGKRWNQSPRSAGATAN